MPFLANTADANHGLKLLIVLRWLALAGQVGLCLFAQYYLGIPLPWAVLIPCMAITALTNLGADICRRKGACNERIACGILLPLDTLILTVMLYWTGGAHNPFATFYLLHIAIATILLSHRAAWGMVLAAGICYALLFLSPHALGAPAQQQCCDGLTLHHPCGSLDFHLQGMLLSMILVGISIVFFSGQLKAKLAKKEAELKQAQLNAARNERFAALATLSAGVAHELATPLGTIAIISEDLEEQAGSGCLSKGCLNDARLIRSEVQRCCDVIEKLRQQTTNGIEEPLQSLEVARIPEQLKAHLKPDHLQRLVFKNLCSVQTIQVPETALLQSLAVLIKNACQSSDTAKPVQLTVNQTRDSLVFTVKDHGKGMPPEIIDRLGEPFFTTKEPGRGMGLGLFLVRMFVERSHGKLSINSTPAQGTTIELTLPLHESTVH